MAPHTAIKRSDISRCVARGSHSFTCHPHTNLYSPATYGNDAMHHLLPSPKSTCYNLQTLGHGLSVNVITPQKDIYH